MCFLLHLARRGLLLVAPALTVAIGLKIDMPTLEAIVEGAGGDIRQVRAGSHDGCRVARAAASDQLTL